MVLSAGVHRAVQMVRPVAPPGRQKANKAIIGPSYLLCGTENCATCFLVSDCIFQPARLFGVDKGWS